MLTCQSFRGSFQKKYKKNNEIGQPEKYVFLNRKKNLKQKTIYLYISAKLAYYFSEDCKKEY